jgi:peptidoglycan hydrolase-like protein with peptidoglycan-binding domain
MSRGLRAAAVTGCTVLLWTTAGIGAPAAMADDTSSAFAVSPTYGQVGQTVTLTAEGATTFPTDGTAGVNFNQEAATAVNPVSPTELTVVVPDGATTGPVSVVADSTTYSGPTFTLQQPTTWTATLSPAVIDFGHKAMVSAALTTGGTVSGPVVGVSATLQHRSSSSGAWHPAAGAPTKSTGTNGRVRWVVRPRTNGEYRVDFAQTPAYGGSTSTPLPMSVRPIISVRHISVAPAEVPTQITGHLRPNLRGVLYLQRRYGHTWRGIQQTTAHHGQFSFTVKPLAYSLLHYRVERLADATHSLALSRVLNIEVVNRELHYGETGADVSTLQRRLRALHYDVGPKTSFYGWDMVHAVTAFQKVMGFHRDGIATQQVWKALAHPKHAHLRYPTPNGVAVEVNLTKQILMIAKNGRIWRILDTSTAGGYTYTDSAGYQATAITPTGHFTIQYKRDGLVKDKLGTLWRPSYFDSSGDAIHGEGNSNYGGDVPPYPASHGCVRITDLAVDRYYNVLAIGVPVSIYH